MLPLPEIRIQEGFRAEESQKPLGHPYGVDSSPLFLAVEYIYRSWQFGEEVCLGIWTRESLV